jgi:hypothetical protein
MKMKAALLALLLIAAFGSAAFAQDSDFYYLNINVVKVYPTKLGFLLIYRVGSMAAKELYLPNEWFQVSFDSDGKPVPGQAEIVYGRDIGYPYMTVYYKAGKFSHLRLFLHVDKAHESYGLLPRDADIESKFKVKEFSISY